MSGTPSPEASIAGASAHTSKPSAPARKKPRINSSSRSSISSIDALINEAMGSNNSNSSSSNNNAAGRLVPTGHRRNITSASLVPLDGPTQIRNYLTPSSTSKKEIPSAFVARRNKLKAKEAAITKPAPGPSTAGRKRTRDEAGGGEVDQLQDDDTPMSNNSHASANNAAAPSTTPSSPTNTGPHVTAELASESSSLLSAIEAKRR